MEGGKLNLIEKFVYELAIPRSLLIDISVLASGGGTHPCLIRKQFACERFEQGLHSCCGSLGFFALGDVFSQSGDKVQK